MFDLESDLWVSKRKKKKGETKRTHKFGIKISIESIVLSFYDPYSYQYFFLF
jgi:hypothetical protein